MGDNSYEHVKLRQYVKYINIISSVLIIVSLIFITDLCLCAYDFNTMPSYPEEVFNNVTAKEQEMEQKSILLFVIITLGLSTTLVIISAILLFLFAMKIIHVTEVGSILSGMHSSPKFITQRPLLQDYEVPITTNNTQNRPRTNNLYTDRTDRNQKMTSKEEMLPIYDKVKEEPTFSSDRRNMSPRIDTSRKQMQHSAELPEYDEVKEFNVVSNSRKMVPQTNDEELPEYHEPMYPNVPNIPQQSRFYDRLREDSEELVDYDEVKIVDVGKINTGGIKTIPHIRQQFPVSVYEEDLVDYDEVREADEELVDYDEVKEVGEGIKVGSSNMVMKQTTKEYSNKSKQNQPAENITEPSSMSDKIHSKSLEDLLQTLNIPSDDKLENNPNNSSNEIKIKNMNEQLYNKKMTPEITRKINYGIKTNTDNSLIQTEENSAKNKANHKSTTRTKHKSSNNRIEETTMNDNAEDSDYDYIKN